MDKQINSRYRKWAVPVAGLAILILFLVGCNAPGPADQGNALETMDVTPYPTSPALAKPTYTVQRGDVVELAHFSGRIEPVVEKELYFHITGRIRTVYVKEDDPVKAGQVLADLEGVDELQHQEAVAKIQIQRSQIQADIAQLNLDYFLKTNSTKAPGYAQQLALHQRQVDLAQLDVTSASLGLTELQSSIANTQLVAPMDGVVTALNLQEGSEVKGFAPVATVADLSALEVSAAVGSSKWDSLSVGMPASILANGGKGHDTTGAVRRLPGSALSGQINPGNDDRMRIQINGSPTDLGYKIGDLVKVDIIIAQSSNTLWVPPQVIRTFDSRLFVVVQDGDIQRRVDVKLGVTGDDRVEVLEGLTEGQVVVSP